MKFIYIFFSVLVSTQRISGDNDYEETPVPIPNTEVKLINAENTCGLPCWKDRKLPDFIYIPL